MLVTNVSNEDGLSMAHILNALKAARFDGITGEDMEKIYQAKRWLSNLASQMAEELRSPKILMDQPRVTENATFRVKAMGSIGSSPTKKSRKKK